jgi:hypothetical protein
MVVYGSVIFHGLTVPDPGFLLNEDKYLLVRYRTKTFTNFVTEVLIFLCMVAGFALRDLFPAGCKCGSGF